MANAALSTALRKRQEAEEMTQAPPTNLRTLSLLVREATSETIAIADL